MWVPIAVWQPCELLYTCYLLTYLLYLHTHYSQFDLEGWLQQEQQPPFYGHYTGQPVLAGSSSYFQLWIHMLHTYIHPFNGPFSGTTQVRQYQKGETNLDFTEARDSEWQWHQLGHMQVCTSLQTDNHASTPPLFFTGRMPFLPPNQQRQSIEGTTVWLFESQNVII